VAQVTEYRYEGDGCQGDRNNFGIGRLSGVSRIRELPAASMEFKVDGQKSEFLCAFVRLCGSM